MIDPQSTMSHEKMCKILMNTEGYHLAQIAGAARKAYHYIADLEREKKIANQQLGELRDRVYSMEMHPQGITTVDVPEDHDQTKEEDPWI